MPDARTRRSEKSASAAARETAAIDGHAPTRAPQANVSAATETPRATPSASQPQPSQSTGDAAPQSARNDAPASRAQNPSAAAAQSDPRNAGAPRRPRRSPAIAALDLGTNNCRLLVARLDGDGFNVIDAFSRIVRLGEGLGDCGRLSQGAMDRAVSALGVCADRLRKHNVQHFRAIATEACRRAANGQSFIDRVAAETGLEIEVIAPEEEARLAVAGCAPLVDRSAERLLVFDIGGGSTELIEIDLSDCPMGRRGQLLTALAHPAARSRRAGEAAERVANWVSLPVGVVTLGEEFDHIIDDAEKFMAMNDHATALLAPFVDRLNGADVPKGDIDAKTRLARMQILGTSGTITTLAGVHLDLERYSRRAVDGLWIATSAVDRVIERLLSLNAYERALIPCIGEDRATNLMSGAAILRAILRAWPTHRLRVADRGLREGMLYGLVDDLRAERRRRPRRRRN